MNQEKKPDNIYNQGRPPIRLDVLLAPDKLSEEKWRRAMRTGSRWNTPKVLFATILWNAVHRNTMEN